MKMISAVHFTSRCVICPLSYISVKYSKLGSKIIYRVENILSMSVSIPQATSLINNKYITKKLATME